MVVWVEICHRGRQRGIGAINVAGAIVSAVFVFRSALAEQNILAFDIAVDDVILVHVVYSEQNFTEYRQGLTFGKSRGMLAEELKQVSPRRKFRDLEKGHQGSGTYHNDVILQVINIVKFNDVWVLQF